MLKSTTTATNTLLLRRMFSGGAHYKYPRNVWSPVGGYWQENVNWKRNSAIAMFFVIIAFVDIFNFSREREYWYGTTPVNSWKWNTNPRSPHRRMVAELEEQELKAKEDQHGDHHSK